MHLQAVMQMWVWIVVISFCGAHGWFIFGRPIAGAIHISLGLLYLTAYVAMWGFS